MTATHPQVDESPRVRYITAAQVCELVPGMTRDNLAQLRFKGQGPRYFKPTPKTILYTEADVIAWVEASARYGTAKEAV